MRYIDLDTYFKEWPGIIVEMGKLKPVGETGRPGTQAGADATILRQNLEFVLFGFSDGEDHGLYGSQLTTRCSHFLPGSGATPGFVSAQMPGCCGPTGGHIKLGIA